MVKTTVFMKKGTMFRNFMIFFMTTNILFDTAAKFDVSVKLAPGETERIAGELIKIMKIGKQDFIESFFILLII